MCGVLRAVGRVHAQGGGHRRIRAFQSQGAAFALFSGAYPSRRAGLLRCAFVITPRDDDDQRSYTHAPTRRADIALHPGAARQEARTAIQGP
jgi:hypothetical protein